MGYRLTYTVSASKAQKSSIAKGGSNKKQVEQDKGCDTKQDSKETKRNNYMKALRDLKLEWFK